MPISRQTPEGENSWTEYRRLVMSNLEEIRETLEERGNRLNKIENELNLIKMKITFVAGIAGFLGSLITVIAHFVFEWLNRS